MIKINMILMFLLLVFNTALYADSFLSVKVKEAKLRAKPQHWAAPLATLKYGDQLLLIEQKDGWVQASSAGKKNGFVQASALSDKKILLATNTVGKTEADMGEAILAGKGFSKATEEQYAKANLSTNFAAVNKLEQIKVSDAEMQKFVESGKLAK